ncbi:MAG: sulfotransferase family 2 domain-containing protein [Pseudomonadota bacterium]
MISDKHNFIFIHVARTGGSVFEQEYRKHYDPKNDPRAERLSPDEKHLNAEAYSSRYPAKFERYLKFGFVRNPYSVLVSSYFRDQYATRMTFPDFVLNHSTHTLLAYDDYFRVNDEYILDFALRYENYDKDLTRLCDLIGIKLRYRKHVDSVLKTNYQNMNEHRTKRIIEATSHAVRKYTVRTGKKLPFNQSQFYDESALKSFLAQYFGDLEKFYLGSHQPRDVEDYLKRGMPKTKIIRKTDYTYYYGCEEKPKMISHIERHCPFILDKFEYVLGQ